MGYSLALNMHDKGHEVYLFSSSREKIAGAGQKGLSGATDAAAFLSFFRGRRLVWLMVPAGEPVDDMLETFIPLLKEGDILVDGGNSHYRDSLRRAATAEKAGLVYADIGISGGPTGARNGACMMVGASDEVFSYLKPLLKDICKEGGYLRIGNSGAGHYVKMVHNGIEYGMMQAIAEGFELMESGPYMLDFQALANLWNNGSVISSWLIELTARMFAADPQLEAIDSVAGSSGTGRWTVEEGLKNNVPLPVISQALYARYRSADQDSFAAKVVAGLRREFGGHEVVEK